METKLTHIAKRASWLCLTVLVAGAPCAAGETAKATAAVAGKVMDGDKPVAKAQVRAVRVVEAGRGRANPFVPAQAGEDGTFQVEGLEAGDHRLCVEVPGTDLLDPCQWSSAPPSLRLAKDTKSSDNVIRLERGVWVEVEVDDAESLYRKKEKPEEGAMILVWAQSADEVFHPAAEVVDSKKTRTYRVLIPKDTDVKIVVRGERVTLADAAGKAIPNIGDVVALRVAEKDKKKTLQYTVKAVE